MILAQVVLQVICSQGSIGLQWKSRKFHDPLTVLDHMLSLTDTRRQAQTNMPIQLLQKNLRLHITCRMIT